MISKNMKTLVLLIYLLFICEYLFLKSHRKRKWVMWLVWIMKHIRTILIVC